MGIKNVAKQRGRSMVLQGNEFTIVALPPDMVDIEIRTRCDTLRLAEGIGDGSISPILKLPSIKKGKLVEIRVKDVIAVREYDGGKFYEGGSDSVLRFPTRGDE